MDGQTYTKRTYTKPGIISVSRRGIHIIYELGKKTYKLANMSAEESIEIGIREETIDDDSGQTAKRSQTAKTSQTARTSQKGKSEPNKRKGQTQAKRSKSKRRKKYNFSSSSDEFGGWSSLSSLSSSDSESDHSSSDSEIDSKKKRQKKRYAMFNPMEDENDFKLEDNLSKFVGAVFSTYLDEDSMTKVLEISQFPKDPTSECP